MPERLSALRRVATIERIGSSTRIGERFKQVCNLLIESSELFKFLWIAVMCIHQVKPLAVLEIFGLRTSTQPTGSDLLAAALRYHAKVN